MASIVLALWTLFVWGVRIKNADGSIAAIVLSLSFIGLALLVLSTKGHALPTVLLGGWTVIVWAVRIVDIVLLSDHTGTFKAVHAGIGTVSILLAGWTEQHLKGPRTRAAAV